MNKPYVYLSATARDYSDLIMLARSVHLRLTNNDYFLDPTPGLSVLKSAIDEATHALAKWGSVRNRGSSADLDNLRIKSRVLWQLVRSEKYYVQKTASQIAGTNYMLMAVILSSSGFPFREKKKQKKKP